MFDIRDVHGNIFIRRASCNLLEEPEFIPFFLIDINIIVIDNDCFIQAVAIDIPDIHSLEFGWVFLTHPETFPIQRLSTGDEVRVDQGCQCSFLSGFHSRYNLRLPGRRLGLCRRTGRWDRSRNRRVEARRSSSQDMGIDPLGEITDFGNELVHTLGLREYPDR